MGCQHTFIRHSTLGAPLLFVDAFKDRVLVEVHVKGLIEGGVLMTFHSIGDSAGFVYFSHSKWQVFFLHDGLWSQEIAVWFHHPLAIVFGLSK